MNVSVVPNRGCYLVINAAGVENVSTTGKTLVVPKASTQADSSNFLIKRLRGEDGIIIDDTDPEALVVKLTAPANTIGALRSASDRGGSGGVKWVKNGNTVQLNCAVTAENVSIFDTKLAVPIGDNCFVPVPVINPMVVIDGATLEVGSSFGRATIKVISGDLTHLTSAKKIAFTVVYLSQ